MTVLVIAGARTWLIDFTVVRGKSADRCVVAAVATTTDPANTVNA
jgi:hypothetical protein